MKTASHALALSALLFASLAGAQTSPSAAGDPPPGSTPVTGEEIKAMVSGKVYQWEAPGSTVTARVQYDASGYAFINVSSGVNDSGTWRVQGNEFCSEWKHLPSSCSETRRNGTRLFVKRTNGTWATLTPQ